jgi:hypothetical protein
MYTLTKNARMPDLLRAEAATFILSFVVANLFYKFGSFGLELAAFLATWWAAGAAWDLIASKKN